MRVTKILGSVVAVGVAMFAMTATTESRAEPGDEQFVSVTCAGGKVTASGAKGWHTNEKAPWKWDKGTKDSIDEHAAKFTGGKCEGTLTAYVCSGTQCKGPIPVPVR